jgi:hypothetical protein
MGNISGTNCKFAPARALPQTPHHFFAHGVLSGLIPLTNSSSLCSQNLSVIQLDAKKQMQRKIKADNLFETKLRIRKILAA